MGNPVDDFLEMEKRGANWGDAFARVGATAATVGAGIVANEVYGAVKGAISKSRGFKAMMNYNPKLQKQDRAKVQAIYNTLHNASPDLARDPLVANSWVNRMMYQDEYIDPKTMSDLTSAQKNISQARKMPDFAQAMLTADVPETFAPGPPKGGFGGGNQRQSGRPPRRGGSGQRRGGARQAMGSR